MRARITSARAAVVALGALLGALLGTVAVSAPVQADPLGSKTVELDAYPVGGECRAQAVAQIGGSTLYVVNGSWRPFDAPYEGTVSCVVNGQVATLPIWLPASLLPLAPAFPIVPYGLALGTALVTGDELTLCVRVEYDLWGGQVAEHCE